MRSLSESGADDGFVIPGRRSIPESMRDLEVQDLEVFHPSAGHAEAPLDRDEALEGRSLYWLSSKCLRGSKRLEHQWGRC